MSNYTKTTNFTAKDGLSGGDPNKVIKGSEFDAEFEEIGFRSADKSNKIIAGTVNAIIIQSAGGDLIDGSQTLPTGTILGTSDTQTVTNKSIDADSNTIINIEDADIKAAAAIDVTKIADGTVTNTEFQYINTLASNVQTQITTNLAAAISITDIDDLSGVTDVPSARSNLGLYTTNHNLLYMGTGNLGASTLSTNTNISAGEYHYTDLTINSGVTLTLNSGTHLVIRCTGTCTVTGNIVVTGQGASGAAQNASDSAGYDGSAGTGGGSGGSGGGDGGGNVAGSGGASTARTANIAGGVGPTTNVNGLVGNTPTIASGMLGEINAYVGGHLLSLTGGGGGGGSLGSPSPLFGNAGGDGGGSVIIIADTIAYTGNITSEGTTPSTGGTNGGGGGGGGGGVIILAANTYSASSGTLSVAGAVGGTSTGGGTTQGGTGGAGYSLVITL